VRARGEGNRRRDGAATASRQCTARCRHAPPLRHDGWDGEAVAMACAGVIH